MTKQSNIILISDDENIEEIMSLRLVPLREMDSFESITYETAVKENFGQPDVIMIYCNEDKEKQAECIKLIRYIRNERKLFATSIILVLDSFNKEFILTAYSENITDFMLRDSEKGATLVKLMWALKQATIVRDLTRTKSFLTEIGILDKNTGFYLSKYREKLFNHELKYLELSDKESSILLIGASEDGKAVYDYKEIADVTKAFLRSSDVIFQGLNEKIYILLPNTPLDMVKNVFGKIKANIANKESVVAVAASINDKRFSNIETALLSALPKANLSDAKFLIVNDVPSDEIKVEDESWQNWFKQNLGTPRNFKIFKAAYTKKLKNVITPTFFQLQKQYEDKYFEVEVNHIIGETTSKFILSKGENESELQINYNGFSRIHVNIVNKGLDSPENENYEIDLSQISEDNITKLVERFIKTFVEFYCC
ncbi:hypothetical protein IJ732_01025 [bacterium]|nr:hypothetical protein [bacterium]